MRLFCDEMLASLARWLRAAGHDTVLAPPGTPDGEVRERCIEENRILISRDRALVSAAHEQVEAVWLPEGPLDAHARALVQAIGIDWTCAPFTRCLADNHPLRAADAEEQKRVPDPFHARLAEVRFCPGCERVYWPGGHVRRMRERLERWRANA